MAAKKPGKDEVARFEKDRLERLMQSNMRAPRDRRKQPLPGLIEDPAEPGMAIPEMSELYPAEKGGAPTGVGADGTIPYSPEYWKKMEKRPPGMEVRADWLRAGQPEEAIPVNSKGQVKRLLQHLRRPGPAASE